MQRVKRRIFSGAVCEQEVFSVPLRNPDRKENLKHAEPPKPRFENDAERAIHREGISRRRFIRIVNTNFSPRSYYITLTFDDAHEVHTFEEARRVLNNYVRRLQYRYPSMKLVAVKGRGKSTSRIHFHAIIDDVPEEDIIGAWREGSVTHISQLRAHVKYDGVDHGADYTGLANYLFDHWTEEQGGHRWKGTRNLKEPEFEAPTEPQVEYSAKRPPVAPKGYKLVDMKVTSYGYMWFKYVRTSKPPRAV